MDQTIEKAKAMARIFEWFCWMTDGTYFLRAKMQMEFFII